MRTFRRDPVALYIIGSYLAPILFFSFYSVSLMSREKSWMLLLLGWALTAAGSMFLIACARRLEGLSAAAALAANPPESREGSDKGSLERLIEENGRLAGDLESCLEELAKSRASLEESRKRELALEELEEEVRKLESALKERERPDEAEEPLVECSGPERAEEAKRAQPLPPPPALTPPFRPSSLQSGQKEALQQLRESLNTAQKMTGAGHFSSPRSYGALSLDNFALDQRRLYESLRGRSACVLLFYSPKEDQLLFASDSTAAFFGWSSEEFAENFSGYIEAGWEEWKRCLAELNGKREGEVKLSIRVREGGVKQFGCLLGLIPTGIFKHFVIAAIYSLEESYAGQLQFRR